MALKEILLKAAAMGCLLVAGPPAATFAQTDRRTAVPAPVAAKPVAASPAQSPVVIQVNDARLKELLKPNGKPLLVNFWATWCDPCREEFPELVKIDSDYRGRIDFITVTLDDPNDIKVAVPRFLSSMKATMPAYLLVSSDESAIISSIAKGWTGGLPFTVLYNVKGEMAYFRQGKVQVGTLRSELDKLALPADDARIRQSGRDAASAF